MNQLKYANVKGEQKVAYELVPREFADLLDNLRAFGDIAKVAIIASNDRKCKRRPRVPPLRDEVEKLQKILGEENAEAAEVRMSDLDVLRVERAEIGWAIKNSAKSDLDKKIGSVVLGHATMAYALDELRDPIIDGSVYLSEPLTMLTMLKQFHSEGTERISLSV